MPLLVALAVGLANGLLVTLIGMQPFVATLILMTVALLMVVNRLMPLDRVWKR